MGTGASKNPQVGMPLSPTVEYAEKRSKKEGERRFKSAASPSAKAPVKKKTWKRWVWKTKEEIGDRPVLIDAPALVDLTHGTVRYRNEGDHIVKAGKELKMGYFYHTRLEDYSEAATVKSEDQFKFKYVYKGTNRSREKQLFYVYGIGFNSKDKQFRIHKPYKPKGRGYVWPSSYRKTNHLYYDLSFVTQETDFSDSEDDDEDVKSDVDPDCMRFRLKDSDTVDLLKKRTAVRLLMPSSNIHINCADDELGDDQLIGKLRTEKDGKFSQFVICLQSV